MILYSVEYDQLLYRCGYCGEEIYTRYAATYHIKYKHPGMSRHFIQNKADVTRYYINRANNQSKSFDTRRVKVPAKVSPKETSDPLVNTSSLDYRTLLAWSCFWATQAGHIHTNDPALASQQRLAMQFFETLQTTMASTNETR
jgi:hypothetical protein